MTSAIRHLGLRDSFGIDHKIHAKVSGPVVALDLNLETSYDFVVSLIQHPQCIYVHFAPPCGTASRARFIKRRFRYNPPVLRTDQFPNGLPNLRADLQARVTAANQLYDVTQRLCRVCHKHGVFFSIENPGRSFMWDVNCIKTFLAEVPHHRTQFHHCQYGSARRKLTLLVHNVPTFTELQVLCDNQHPHEPWGQMVTGWATAEETAYPWELCRTIATKLALCLQNMGAVCAPPIFATQTVHLQEIRQQTLIQHASKSLPLVSEFSSIQNIPADAPIPTNARLLSTPPLGHIAIQDNWRT